MTETVYTILSINEDRKAYTDVIHERVSYPYVKLPAVNGMEIDIPAELDRRGLFLPCFMRYGEIGVWLSSYDCWTYARDNDVNLIIFEDDAIPHEHFNWLVDQHLETMPEDWDFLALWVPDNQRHDIGHEKFEKLSYTYQGYGAVAMMVSPGGAAKLIEATKEIGLYTPLDCFYFQERASGRVPQGFSPRPKYATIVDYDWTAPTTIHNTDRTNGIERIHAD